MCGNVRLIGRQQQRRPAGNHISPFGRALQCGASQSIGQRRADPPGNPVWIGRLHFVPVHENKRERPRGQNPAERAAHADETEVPGVLQVRERNLVGNRKGRHVKQAIDQHQTEEWPECLRHRQAEQCESAHEMAERHEFFRRKIPVGKLVAEEHADDGGHRKGVQNQGLLHRRKIQAGQITENERQPCAPDEKFQNHHAEQPDAERAVHERHEFASGFRGCNKKFTVIFLEKIPDSSDIGIVRNDELLFD